MASHLNEIIKTNNLEVIYSSEHYGILKDYMNLITCPWNVLSKKSQDKLKDKDREHQYESAVITSLGRQLDHNVREFADDYVRFASLNPDKEDPVGGTRRKDLCNEIGSWNNALPQNLAGFTIDEYKDARKKLMTKYSQHRLVRK